MRISDWSSDVCSSDLSPLLLIGCGKMGGAMLAGWLAGPEADGGVHVVEPNAGGMGELARHPRVTVHADAASPPGEIGRASCRERAWQYVEISGVAGSLKKKHSRLHHLTKLQSK